MVAGQYHAGNMRKSLTREENEKLVRWLKAKREERNLTTRDLSAQLEKAHTFVTKVELQERRLDVAEYLDYCRLGVHPFEGLIEMDPSLKKRAPKDRSWALTEIIHRR